VTINIFDGLFNPLKIYNHFQRLTNIESFSAANLGPLKIKPWVAENPWATESKVIFGGFSPGPPKILGPLKVNDFSHKKYPRASPLTRTHRHRSPPPPLPCPTARAWPRPRPQPPPSPDVAGLLLPPQPGTASRARPRPPPSARP
jgi:hypothetical protein